jgi:AcrR family transcriptional regulator
MISQQSSVGTLERPAMQLRSRESRDRLIKAGFRAFARDGYEKSRIADIAGEAGISVGSFYHRFGDKRGFFNVLATEFVQLSEDNWDRFFELVDPNASVDEVFVSVVTGMARIMRRNIGFFHALLSLGREDPEISAKVQSADLYAAKKLLSWLQEKGCVASSGITEEKTYFAINTIGKKLAFSFVIEGPKCRADDAENIAELARMVQSYLALGVDK